MPSGSALTITPTRCQARLLPAYVEIFYDRECVARHECNFGRHQQVLDLEHYLEVLERKPGGLAGSRLCRATRSSLWSNILAVLAASDCEPSERDTTSMNIASQPEMSKVTIAPLDYVKVGMVKTPVRIIDGISIEDVSGQIRPQHFDLWRDYLSQEDRQRMPNVRYALVHRFSSPGHVGRQEEESKDLVYKTFLCLRLIRPTRSRYSVIQFKQTGPDSIDVFSFTHPSQIPIYIPDSEILNHFSNTDFAILQQIIGPFLHIAEHGPEHLRRAIRYYESGYSNIFDPAIQIMVWTMGLEAVVSTSDEIPSRRNLLERISELVAFDRNIYEDSPLAEFQPAPVVQVQAVIHDLLKLRSRLSHGGWFQTEMEQKITRKSVDGRVVSYSGILRETASFLLRNAIRARLLSTATA